MFHINSHIQVGHPSCGNGRHHNVKRCVHQNYAHDHCWTTPNISAGKLLLSCFLVWLALLESVSYLSWFDLCLLCVVRYYCSPSATISDAVAAYDQSYCGQSAYASCPLPHYVEKLAIDDLADGVQDVCYHLLKLYCDRSHPLHVLLSTAAVTDNPLDYSLRFVDMCHTCCLVFTRLRLRYVYLGSLIHSSTGSTCDISRRSAVTHAAMQSLENQIWRSRLAISTKLKLYNTCILPIFLYGSDCWAMSKMDARKMMHSTSGVCVCCLASGGTSLYGMMMYGG